VTGLFVTGTDTNVGKTVVACALARGWRARGRRVAVMKPVETGVAGEPEDAMRLRAAAADPAPLDAVCPWRFAAPLAPAWAARAAGAPPIDLDALVAHASRRAAEADVLLVEGAGGLLVPVSGRATWVDVAARLALPVLVVAANRLGTINHAALTARVAAEAGLVVRGFVLSHPTAEHDPSADTNAAAIAELTGLRCLGVVPWAADALPAADVFDWAGLEGGGSPGSAHANAH
jgi:dethiobiotin synthetase